jgi:rubrerythrin
MSDTELARALRLDAAAEIDAMNLYEAHIEATDNADAKKLLAFIAKDEKEHFELFMELIRRLDPQEAEEMQGIAAKLEAILRSPTGVEVSEAQVEAAAESPGSDGSLNRRLEQRELVRRSTIGSLFGQPQS